MPALARKTLPDNWFYGAREFRLGDIVETDNEIVIIVDLKTINYAGFEYQAVKLFRPKLDMISLWCRVNPHAEFKDDIE
jgi:hypothetical protein